MILVVNGAYFFLFASRLILVTNTYVIHGRSICVNLQQIFKLEKKKESICNVQKMVTKIIYFKDGGVLIAKKI